MSVPVPVEVFVNVTASGQVPEVGDPVKFATGSGAPVPLSWWCQ